MSFLLISIFNSELKIIENYSRTKDSSVLINSLYTPYRELWVGYVGNENHLLTGLKKRESLIYLSIKKRQRN